MKKIILPVLAAVFIMTLSARGVYGADFDPVYYAQRYPDIANTVGCDEKALLDHYTTVGQKEGRYPNALAECEGRAREIEIQNARALGNDKVVEELTKAHKAATTVTSAPAVATAPALPTFLTGNAVTVPALDPVTMAVQTTGTYVDVDIANQTMTLYVNGMPVLTSPCVTGTPKDNRSTPTGAFFIMEKIPGKRLKGDTWDVWVDRWMKFTKGAVGLHDASWRKKFGGNIYKSNGSHGCVNLPTDVAYSLYDLVVVGTPVIVH